MKKYIADVLTASRMLAAIILIVLIWTDLSTEWALWVFALGELSDAADGIAARKWPFPEGEEPFYRRWAELYDMIFDVCLGLSALAYIWLRIDHLSGISITVIVLTVGVLTEIAVWGWPFGAPEHCSKNCLYRERPQTATTLVLLRRRLYLAVIGTALMIMLFATEYGTFTKISLMGLTVVIGLVLLVVKKDRLTEIKTK